MLPLPFLFPFHPLHWETDATVRAAAQATLQGGLAPVGAGAVLAGGEIAADARAAGPRSEITAEGRAAYARAVDTAGGAPSEDVGADASGSATFTLTPLATLSFSAQGSLATSWGIRADSLMLTRDPFLDARRLEYGLGGDLTYTLEAAPRVELGVDAGYAQEGAIAADVPAAVGVDSREVHGGVSYGVEVGPRSAITPELRYTFTHFDHALLSVDRLRGPADVHAVSASLGGSRKLSPDLTLRGSAGITVGSPMPIAGTGAAVIAPEVGAGLRWRGRRAQVTARYAWSYSALGPRLGYGQQHTALVRAEVWPVSRPRGTSLRIVARAGHGAAPVGADPPPIVPGMPPPVLTGRMVATTLGARAALEVPLAPGWSLTGGVDLMFARGHLDPAPPGSGPQQQLTGMITLGIAATASTDPRRRFPRDPGSDADVETRRAGVQMPGDRWEDRTRIDEGRSAEEP